jgi:predicted transcriptional regulator
MAKVNITVWLEDDIVASLAKLAKHGDRDRSYLISKAVESYISVQQWQIHQTRKAITEAEAGDFASDDEVEAMFTEFTR